MSSGRKEDGLPKVCPFRASSMSPTCTNNMQLIGRLSSPVAVSACCIITRFERWYFQAWVSIQWTAGVRGDFETENIAHGFRTERTG